MDETGGASRFFHTILPAGALNTECGLPDRKKGEKMAGIFTRPEIAKILNNADLTPEERADQIFSLYGRALDDGYVTKKAAEAAQSAAIESAQKAWAESQPKVNVLDSEEYKKLQGEYEGFKTKTNARNSDEFKEVKPKFFDRVYDLIDRADGAKSVSEQLADMKKEYEEYFLPAEPAPAKPQFGAKPEGSMPKGQEGAVAAFTNAWNFSRK